MSNNLWKKRILREIQKWDKESEDPGYANIKINFNESSLDKGIIVIYCINEDSPFWGLPVFIEFTIPSDYPHKNPGATFLNPLYFSSGIKNCRIHPNLYENGKVCLSIIGTWNGEPWRSCYTIRVLAKIIEGILSENPIVHEPCKNNCDKDSNESKEYTLNSMYRSFYIVTNLIEKYKEKQKDMLRLVDVDWVVEKIIENREKYIQRHKDLKKTVTPDNILHGKEERDFPALLDRFIKLTEDMVTQKNENISETNNEDVNKINNEDINKINNEEKHEIKDETQNIAINEEVMDKILTSITNKIDDAMSKLNFNNNDSVTIV